MAGDDPLERGLDALDLEPATRARLERRWPRVRDLVQRSEFELLKDNVSRSEIAQVKAALAAHDLTLGMMLDPAPAIGVSDPQAAAAILAAEPQAIDALARGDTRHWQALAEHLLLHRGLVASPAVVHLLLAREPSIAQLLAAARSSLWDADSELFTTMTSALRAIRPWLDDGIAAVLEPTHPAVFELRYERELGGAEGGVAAARALVADVRQGAPPRPPLADALVLLARRAHEDGLFEESLAAAAEAGELFTDGAATAMAQRLRGAALLSLERFDEAFAILDEAMSSCVSPLPGASRFGGREVDPPAAAIGEAATVAAWAELTTPEWVRALGGMAERTGREDLWRRFEAALVAMVDGAKDPASDLEVVIRQAGQRELDRTVKAARDLAAARGLDPDSVRNVYFG